MGLSCTDGDRPPVGSRERNASDPRSKLTGQETVAAGLEPLGHHTPLPTPTARQCVHSGLWRVPTPPLQGHFYSGFLSGHQGVALAVVSGWYEAAA